MNDDLKSIKIALVHDYLLRMGGAERVLKVMHEMFPEAPIYIVLYDESFANNFLSNAVIKESFLQKAPLFLRKRYKYFSFLIPSAVENLDLSDYDLVISSCSAFSKGIITRPNTLHISYCHTPTRFLWDWAHPYAKSLEQRGLLGNFAKMLLHILRLWDQQAAKRVDYFIANSNHVASRIRKYYRRDSRVIYPPCFFPNVDEQIPSEGLPKGDKIPQNYYLIVSQLRAYKQIDIAIEAFKKLGFQLLIIGQGSEEKRLKVLSRGFDNIKIIGYQPDDILGEYYKNSRAFIFSGEEDFGMTMVEQMLYGKPVLALRKGGATEIVLEGVTGEFFDDIHPVLLADGVRRLNENYARYDAEIIKKRANTFSRERFEKELLEFIKECYNKENNV